MLDKLLEEQALKKMLLMKIEMMNMSKRENV